MKVNTLCLAAAAAAILLGFAASSAEAKPPSQIPSGYQAYLDQKAKSASKACCPVGKMECCQAATMGCCHSVKENCGSAVKGNCCSAAVPAGGSGKAPHAYHDRKHGGGGYGGVR